MRTLLRPLAGRAAEFSSSDPGLAITGQTVAIELAAEDPAALSRDVAALGGSVDAVAGRCDVLFDGGVRTGQDVLKALALGARGCLMGKAFLYALAARGEAGVALALDIIRKELAVSLALTGANDVRKVTRDVLV